MLVAASCGATCATDTSYARDTDCSSGFDELHCEGTETYQPNSEWYQCYLYRTGNCFAVVSCPLCHTLNFEPVDW